MHAFHVLAATHPLMAALLLFILIPAVLVWIGYSITEKARARVSSAVGKGLVVSAELKGGL